MGAAAALLVGALAVGAPTDKTPMLTKRVQRVFAASITSDNLRRAVRDLERLGPAALPVITSEIERLHGWALVAAVQCVAASHHRPAAAVVARRLVDREHADVVMAYLLPAAGRLGGDALVPALSAVARSRERDGWTTRLRAFLALVEMGSARSIDAAIAALDAPRPARPQMPSAAAFTEVIGRPLDEAARLHAMEREDVNEYLRLGRGLGAARVPLPGGRILMVFPDRWLGTFADLWVQEFGPDGRPEGPATVLGITMEGRLCPHECPIAPELRGDILTVHRPDTPETVRVDLKEARRDSDGDGFTDLVERRLSLDPGNADSDGDGMADAVDPAPNARTRPASTEVEQIRAAIFEQYFAFTDDSGQPVIFLGPPSQPLEGRTGPTLVIASGEEERVRDRYPGLPFVRIAPDEDPAAVAPGQRRYVLVTYTGPISGAVYVVVVSRVRGRWLMRSVAVRSMS